jgi:hypothetical protein
MRVLVVAREEMTGERIRAVNALIALVRTTGPCSGARKPLTADLVSHFRSAHDAAARRRSGGKNGGGAARNVVSTVVRMRPPVSLTPGTGS